MTSETELNEQLKANGLMQFSHGPGVYVLEVSVPDAFAEVCEAWDDRMNARPEESTLKRLADAERVAYLGASPDVYSRLSDHVCKTRRQTAFLSVFPPTKIVDIWPCDTPFEREYRKALELSQDGWTVWVDGELVG